MQLERFLQPITPQQLTAVIFDDKKLPTSTVLELPGLADLKEKLGSGEYSSSDDAEVGREIHLIFRDLDDRVTTDTQMWQWLTATQFKHYVRSRWSIDEEDMVKHSAQIHFLGGGSLTGVSRNALARLYWAANALWTEESGYEYSDQVLGDQDLYAAIFERNLGLHPPLARELAKQCGTEPEAVHRAWIKNVNHVLTTVAIEGLNEEQLAEFVLSCRP